MVLKILGLVPEETTREPRDDVNAVQVPVGTQQSTHVHSDDQESNL